MSLKNPKPGAMSVGHYQISAIPWITQSNWKTNNQNFGTVGVYRWDFPTVTRFVRVANHTAASDTSNLCVAFTANGLKAGTDDIGNHFFTVPQNSSVELAVRCTTLFVSGANGMDSNTYDVVAGLTEIPGNMMSLSASNGGSQSGAG